MCLQQLHSRQQAGQHADELAALREELKAAEDAELSSRSALAAVQGQLMAMQTEVGKLAGAKDRIAELESDNKQARADLDKVWN